MAVPNFNSTPPPPLLIRCHGLLDQGVLSTRLAERKGGNKIKRQSFETICYTRCCICCDVQTQKLGRHILSTTTGAVRPLPFRHCWSSTVSTCCSPADSSCTRRRNSESPAVSETPHFDTYSLLIIIILILTIICHNNEKDNVCCCSILTGQLLAGSSALQKKCLWNTRIRKYCLFRQATLWSLLYGWFSSPNLLRVSGHNVAWMKEESSWIDLH